MRLALSLALFALFTLMSSKGVAFELHHTDDGEPVHWGVSSVQVVVDEASAEALGDGAREAIAAAFGAWLSVEGAELPEVHITVGPVDEIGYRSGAENHSTVRFVEGGHAPAGLALATTVISFDQAGRILDADIVINGLPGRRFAVFAEADEDDDDDERHDGAFDLQDVLTHEVGHFFGLAHNDGDGAATMFPDIAPGELSKRSLNQDDEAGLRALYVPAAAPAAACAFGAEPRSRAPLALGLALVVAASLAARRSARRA